MGEMMNNKVLDLLPKTPAPEYIVSSIQKIGGIYRTA